MTILDRPAMTPEGAFVRFVNALHWAADFDEANFLQILDVDLDGTRETLGTVLARLERAEQDLVLAFIDELTAGGRTFTEARAIWKRGWSDRHWSDWHDPAGFLRFLLAVRDAIDPQAGPAPAPRFRPEPGDVGS